MLFGSRANDSGTFSWNIVLGKLLLAILDVWCSCDVRSCEIL